MPFQLNPEIEGNMKVDMEEDIDQYMRQGLKARVETTYQKLGELFPPTDKGHTETNNRGIHNWIWSEKRMGRSPPR